MDCSMPQMDGFETTKHLLKFCRDNSCGLPYVVALTAHSQSNANIVQKCTNAGMDECVGKPISADYLRVILDKSGLL